MVLLTVHDSASVFLLSITAKIQLMLFDQRVTVLCLGISVVLLLTLIRSIMVKGKYDCHKLFFHIKI